VGHAVLTAKGLRWFRSGHPWVYRDDLGVFECDDGETVDVLDPRGAFCAKAFASAHSKIALRIVSRVPEPVDEAFWDRRIERAIARRAHLLGATDAIRWISSEADGIPGLIADAYRDRLVLASSTAAIDALLASFADRLAERLGMAMVIDRSDGAARDLEGRPRRRGILRGAGDTTVWVFEETPAGRIEYPVDTWGGQKTGAYLDQRENRWAAAKWARGRIADVFCYTGLGALVLSPQADQVIAVDTSEPSLSLGRAAAERNRIANVSFLRANAFEVLKAWQRAGERFDAIVLDPPAFARSRRDLAAAERAYEEINGRALRLLRRDGILITSSCSYHLNEEAFVAVIRRAAARARCDAWILERRGQASDHPVLLALPESRYLTWMALRVHSASLYAG